MLYVYIYIFSPKNFFETKQGHFNYLSSTTIHLVLNEMLVTLHNRDAYILRSYQTEIILNGMSNSPNNALDSILSIYYNKGCTKSTFPQRETKFILFMIQIDLVTHLLFTPSSALRTKSLIPLGETF